jgi:hypothetical protein
MKKSHLVIALAVVLIAGVFAADYWLRAHKKYVGDEVVDPPVANTGTPTDKKAPAPTKAESFDTLFERAEANDNAHERARLWLSLDGDLMKAGADALDKRKKVLHAIIKSCPDEPASADAASRLIVIAEGAKDESALAEAVQSFLDTAMRLGIYEKGVTPWLLDNVTRFLQGHKELAAKLQTAFDSPENYGPEEVREIVRFRVGMKLAGDPFSAADKVDQVIKYRRRNLTKKPLSEELSWRDAVQGPWKIEPVAAHVSLAPGAEHTLEFHVQFDRAMGETVPFPSLKSVITREGEAVVETVARVPMDTRGYRAGRVVRCVRTQKAPTIDGTLNDDAWTKCEPASKLFCFDGFTAPPCDTQISACYDDKGLYLAMRVFETDMEHVPAAVSTRDADVCKDDSIEVMFNPKPEQTDYFQMIVNSKNTQYDGICWDRKVNLDWKSATGTDEKGWLAEMFLPWSEFAVEDVPRAGTKMVVNFFRNRYRGQHEHVLLQWSPTMTNNNHLQEYYGMILFE